jgi:hypothetical protein
MVVGSLYGTSLTDLCLKSKHLRLRLPRQKPAERAGRFLIVQGRVPPSHAECQRYCRTTARGSFAVKGESPVRPPQARPIPAVAFSA